MVDYIDMDPRSKNADFDAMLEMQEDLDPAVIAVAGAAPVTGTNPVIKNTPRHSAATLQRCKTVNTYIDKLQGDIRMLTNVRECLQEVTVQLEKEKIDTMMAERISKEAVNYYGHLMESGSFGTLIENSLRSAHGPTTRSGNFSTATATPGPSFASSVSVNQEDMKLFGNIKERLESGMGTGMDDSLLEDSVIAGLHEPDLPYVESEEEEELLDLDLEITM